MKSSGKKKRKKMTSAVGKCRRQLVVWDWGRLAEAFSRNSRAFFTSRRQSNRNRLFPAPHAPAFAGAARTQRAALSSAHCARDRFACSSAVAPSASSCCHTLLSSYTSGPAEKLALKKFIETRPVYERPKNIGYRSSWARQDLNLGPTDYESAALTS
jgi:hypothetical protein